PASARRRPSTGSVSSPGTTPGTSARRPSPGRAREGEASGSRLASVSSSPPTAPFGREVIESILPHRPPFLLIDEVSELEPGQRVVARREVRSDDWWFPGHFPERPVMPGVLIVEAMAQTGAVAVLVEEENR